MVFGARNPEKIGYRQLINLATSPVSCSHFTLGESKKWTVTGTVNLLTTSEKCHHGSPMKLQNDRDTHRWQPGNQEAQHQGQPFQQVRYGVGRGILKMVCTNLIFVQPGASTIETSCWCRSCYQWSAASLETCLSSSKTAHQHIALTTQSSCKTP